MMEEEKLIKKSIEDYKNALSSKELIVQKESLSLLEKILFKNFKVIPKSKIVNMNDLQITAEELGLNKNTGTHLYNVLCYWARGHFRRSVNDPITLDYAVDLYEKIQDCSNKVRQIGKVSQRVLEEYLKKKGFLED